jgi:hypothetical protein
MAERPEIPLWCSCKMGLLCWVVIYKWGVCQQRNLYALQSLSTRRKCGAWFVHFSQCGTNMPHARCRTDASGMCCGIGWLAFTMTLAVGNRTLTLRPCSIRVQLRWHNPLAYLVAPVQGDHQVQA